MVCCFSPLACCPCIRLTIPEEDGGSIGSDTRPLLSEVNGPADQERISGITPPISEHDWHPTENTQTVPALTRAPGEDRINGIASLEALLDTRRDLLKINVAVGTSNYRFRTFRQNAQGQQLLSGDIKKFFFLRSGCLLLSSLKDMVLYSIIRNIV